MVNRWLQYRHQFTGYTAGTIVPPRRTPPCVTRAFARRQRVPAPHAGGQQKGKRHRKIGCLLNEAPEDLPRRNGNGVLTRAVSAGVHPLDDAALPAARSRKCASKPLAVELPIALLASDRPLVLLVRRGLNEPRCQMMIAWIPTISADCQVTWYNPPLLEIVAQPVVPRVWNFFRMAPIC
jgi:hypothetical protein